MSPATARARFSAARVARLATADAAGAPHLVPVVFAVSGDTVYTAVDHKPKRSSALRRLANVRTNPAVALLADHYDDADWDALWWVRADGMGRVLQPGVAAVGAEAAERAEGAEAAEAADAVARLAARYPQYRQRPPAGPVLAVAVHRWSGWQAVTGGR